MATDIYDNRTAHLDLPLPNVRNKLAQDVFRIGESFQKLDRHAEQADQAAASLQNAARELDRKLDSEISNRTHADIILKATADEQAAGLEALAAASQAHGEGILGLEQSLQAETARLEAADALLWADVQNRGIYNSKAILTVSGPWTAPVTGWYSATLISGGYGSVVQRRSTSGHCTGITGCSGVYLFNQLLYLEKGTVVPVTIGAAGKGYRVNPDVVWTWSISLTGPSKTVEGGHTSFGSLTTAKSQTELTADNPAGFRFPSEFHGSDTSLYKPGTGFGASDISSHSRLATWYGASGGCYVESGSQVPYDGYQGCVILYWFDPAKANGPAEGE